MSARHFASSPWLTLGKKEGAIFRDGYQGHCVTMGDIKDVFQTFLECVLVACLGGGSPFLVHF